MRFLVTGGAGFIGSNIVDELVRRDHSVVVLDNLSTGKTSHFAEVGEKIEFVEGNICDLKTVAALCPDVDCVLHLAARTSVPESVEDPRTVNQVNVEGTLNVLWAAKEAKVRRVVYASSCAAYGDSAQLPLAETQKTQPLSPYGVSKLVGEMYAQVFSRVYGLETVALRYFNVFGPRQDPTSPYSGVLSRFMTAVLKGEPPVVYGDGEQSRDFVYVENIVDITLRAAEATGVSGQVFNAGTGSRVTLNQTLELLGKISGQPVPPKYEPARPGDIRHSQADMGLARRELGYEPRVGFEEGLRRTLDWYRANSR